MSLPAFREEIHRQRRIFAENSVAQFFDDPSETRVPVTFAKYFKNIFSAKFATTKRLSRIKVSGIDAGTSTKLCIAHRTTLSNFRAYSCVLRLCLGSGFLFENYLNDRLDQRNAHRLKIEKIVFRKRPEQQMPASLTKLRMPAYICFTFFIFCILAITSI